MKWAQCDLELPYVLTCGFFADSVVYEPLEQVDEDVEVIRLTPSGLTANVNNSSVGSENIFVAYRRADPLADCNVLTVVDICVIVANKVRYRHSQLCSFIDLLGVRTMGDNIWGKYAPKPKWA